MAPPDALATTMTSEPAKRAGPALSATSDLPVPVAASAEPAQPGPQVDKPAETPDKSATEGDKPTGEEVPAKPDLTPPAVKREITLERNKRRAAEDAAKLAEERLDKALAALDQVNRPQEQSGDPRPVRETFTDPGAYDKALEDWAGRHAAAKALADDETRRATEARETANRAVIDTYTARKAAFTEDHPDYAELVESDDLHFSIPMTYAIVNDEDGPAIAYYLAQNPEEFARIAKLGDAQAATAIGRIAARLQQRPAAPVKPDPIRPVGARSGAMAKSPSEESMDEYAKRRTPEILASRKPFIAGRNLN